MSTGTHLTLRSVLLPSLWLVALLLTLLLQAASVQAAAPDDRSSPSVYAATDAAPDDRS